MTIDEAQKQVDEWIKTVGVRYFSELTNMACLTEEVGELARVMARRYGVLTSVVSFSGTFSAMIFATASFTASSLRLRSYFFNACSYLLVSGS